MPAVAGSFPAVVLGRLRSAGDRWLPLRRPVPTTLVVLGVFALALAARLLWVAYVESPYDNIYSDMGGYIQRARQAAYGSGDPYPIFATYFPPGTHLLYAAEMKLVGFDHHAPMLVLNCMWGAVVAPCATLLAMRIVPRVWIAAVVGVVVALWYPLLAFAGFFSSEQPYAGALALSTWLLVRLVDRGRGAVALGLASAVAYLVRPQIVMTLAVLTVVGLLVLLRQRLGRLARMLRLDAAPRLPVGRLVIAGTILTAAVAYGALRYHALCGRWGLISDNSAVARLGADTNYGAVRSKQGFFFSSPPKNEIGETRELVVDGYVGDPVVIDRARRNEVHYMSTGERVVRWISNVRFLFVRNSLWPPSAHMGTGWRLTAYEVTHTILLDVLCPLAFVGMIACLWQPRVVTLVCTAQLLTMLVVAAFFCGEQRYRVPYDVFFVLMSLEGVRWAVTLARSGFARLSLARPRAQSPT
jgi:hypothetical protein